MGTNWRAVLLGATVMLLLNVSYGLVTQDATGAGILVGSATAGYLCDRSLRGSAWHGVLTGILGMIGLITLIALDIISGGLVPTVVVNLIGVGTIGIVLAALIVIFGSLPNAIAGVVGGLVRAIVNE